MFTPGSTSNSGYRTDTGRPDGTGLLALTAQVHHEVAALIALYGLPQSSSWIAWLSGLLNLSAPYGPRRVAADAAKNLGISLEG